MLLTHILATTILLKAFVVSDIRIIILSYIFGVLIDLDELYALFKFRKKSRSWKDFEKIAFKRENKKRTWIQESGGLTISLTLSILIKSFIPFYSNLVHCIMDWLSSFESNPLAPFYNKLKTRGFIKTMSLINVSYQEIYIIVVLVLILCFV
jgi:hypothetical protein